MPFILYTMAEATKQYNAETQSSCTEETVRNRIKAARLTIHRIGNLDLVATEDLIRLVEMPAPMKGRPRKMSE